MKKKIITVPVFIFFLLNAFFCYGNNSTDSLPGNSDKKDFKQLLAKLQSTEVAKETLATKKTNLAPAIKTIIKDLNAVQSDIDIHNIKNGIFKEGTPEADQFIAEAKQLNDKKAAIIDKGDKLDKKNDSLQALIDNANFEIASLRGKIRTKAFNVLRFFNTPLCGNMPSEKASVMEWKSYLDCLFDGTPRNLPAFVEPKDPGGTKIFSNDQGAPVVVPDYDPIASENKQSEIKKLIAANGKKPKVPFVVPAPSTATGVTGSFSDHLWKTIDNLLGKQ